MYESTRHNVGFWLIDELSRLHGITLKKPWFKNWESGCAAFNSDHKLTLVKPLTFMNRSGDILADNPDFRPGPDRMLLVCCDQMDLPSGSLRLKRQGGTAGHNGLKSIHAVIGTEFAPLYIGIGRPDAEMAVVDYVLGVPPEAERLAISDAVGRAARGVSVLLDRGIDPAIAEINKKTDAASPLIFPS
jgi:PTH1 family peptidyl-tRNA hydrolase